MLNRIIRRLALVSAATIVALTGALVATATPASADVTIAARTLVYDASRAGEYVNTFHQAAQVWNSNVANVRLVSGSPANIIIRVDNGWPRAYVTRLGSGTVYMGRAAVNQGHYPLRIATHELGHILGLPDRRTGLCTDLMSGSSAPASCRNAVPSLAERAQVNRNFAGSFAATNATATGRLYGGCVY